MKKLLVVFSLSFCFAINAMAQQNINLADFEKHLGKTETLCDTIYSVKIVSDTLTLINMGGNFPNQKYTVVIRGNKISLDWVNLKRKYLCVTGVLELYKNTHQVAVSEPNQVV